MRTLEDKYDDALKKIARLKADIVDLQNRPEKRIEVPVERVVERVVTKRVEVPVERVVTKRVEVPVEKIVERVVTKRVEVPVERVVTKRVEVPVERVVTKRVEVPVERVVERVVTKRVEVPVEKIVKIPGKPVRDPADITKIREQHKIIRDLEKTIADFWKSPKVKVIEK